MFLAQEGFPDGSNEHQGIGFLNGPRRLNMALTGAKYGVRADVAVHSHAHIVVCVLLSAYAVFDL
jgi:hypothetical protein